jgi:hypothetical protein
MPALERLLRNLYGSTPQIDLDRKLARSRAVPPQVFDFQKLGDGMKRANVDLMGITLQATAAFRGGKAVLEPTGQSFPLEAARPDAPAERRTFQVLDWMDPARTRLRPAP